MIVASWWTPGMDDDVALPVQVEADNVGGINIHIDPGKPVTQTLTVSVEDGWKFLQQFARELVAAERVAA